ncbi:3-deoxy-7-phosphoheptulonate synthase [Adhaeretor mobilis]|uniref:Phospho-2-dehydro-3-deoxyheptonate aldolase n=1 Tax=Adhaeretor mobilis TaxID=1930276 RepID=A0A517MWL9_9BACT|nr:3-deoxy-7-phosphoheptulonate synthase [Adhaeretor mobilis]QDS99275.1 Phospho-2-dehydro-3-deoxyheptonate aldolase [Adhaeretor mobilis]
MSSPWPPTLGATNLSSSNLPIPDPAAFRALTAQLDRFPALVFAGETTDLKRQLASVSNSDAFLLQGGDCAESFAEFSSDNIRDLFKVILQMAAVLTFAGRRPVAKVGRVAGQLVKPRSKPEETRDGESLHSYRGYIVNAIEFNGPARAPDPQRMLQSHNQSAATLNIVRALAQGGLADLHNVGEWMVGVINDPHLTERYDSHCDPRLNADQALELAFLVAATLRDHAST